MARSPMADTTKFAVLASRCPQPLQNILGKVEKARRNKRTQPVQRSTPKDLNPPVQGIVESNDDLDRPREDIRALIKENGAGGDGARKCFSCALFWEMCLYWVSSSRDRLWRRRDNSFDVDDKQALRADVKDTIYKVREILVLLSRENFDKRLNFGPVKHPCGVPEYPGFTIGLDEPLRELKTEALRDGMSLLVLTGLGGAGKTTLAAKLCWDEQVKDLRSRLLSTLVLRLLDISNCISLPSLPEEIGDLSNLRSLYMTSCANCELPFSVTNLENLKVICDEEIAASWEALMPMLPNLKTEVPQVDVNLKWLHPISS